MPNLYSSQSSDAKANAQRNLVGRTHYVDDDTLRFHKARIVKARNVHNGLLFWLIESVAADYQGTKRGFRFVVFDLFGHVLDGRADLDNLYRSSAAAEEALWAYLESIDWVDVSEKGLEREERNHLAEIQRTREMIRSIAEADEAR